MPNIHEWIAFEQHIDAELAKVALEEGKNIEGLECLVYGEKIKYQHSPFSNVLSPSLKQMYKDAGLPGQKKFFTCVFEDDKAFFLEYAHIIAGARLYVDAIALSRVEGPIVEPLFQGHFNKAIDEAFVAEEKMREYIEYHTPVFREVIEKASVKPTLYVDFVSIAWMRLKHALAIICFLKDDVFNICIYDPMYYYRGPGNSYDTSLTNAYCHYYLLGKASGIPVNIINLSAFCPETPKGRHCVQYQIDADYCSMYCLYLLYLYAKNGYPRESADLKNVVDQTFIVSPLNLTRQVCVKTNIFKIKMMSFMLHVCILYSKENFPEFYPKFIQIAKTLSASTGLQLVVLPLEGGRRRRQRRTIGAARKTRRKRT